MNNKGCSWLSHGLFLTPSTVGNTVGVKSCCRFSDIMPFTNEKYSGLQDLLEVKKNPNWNYEYLKNNSCNNCYQEEQISDSSMRTKTLKIDSAVPENKIALLQISFSNFCNLKCKYCQPTLSTEWNNEAVYLKDLYDKGLTTLDQKYLREVKSTPAQTFEYEKNVIELLKNQDLSYIKQVGIFGGEPFMARHFEEFVELLSKQTKPENVELQINTNATIFPKQKVLDLLKLFGKVDLRCSVEATGELAEYIRNGLVWNTFEKNVEQWVNFSKTTQNIKVRIHATHTVWSINKAQNFIDWLEQKGYLDTVVNSFSYEPTYTDIRKVLSDQQLDQLYVQLDSLSNTKMKKHLQSIVSDRSQQKYHQLALAQFQEFTRVFDPRTPHTLQQVNPELWRWTHS